MKVHAMLAISAGLVLAACGGPAANDSTAAGDNAAEANGAEPATVEAGPAATATAGAAPTREFVVGRWGDDGDCTLAIDFRADGTTDGPFGNWTLDGDRLSMADNPQAMTVSVIDQNTMESRLDGGPPRRMTRC